jgi:hypothetical protein
MNELPISLKKTLKKALNNPEKSGKHKSLIDFSETLLVYVCSYIIGEYRKAGIETLEYEKLFFKNNKNLSTGTYQMFLREGLKTLSKSKVEIGISNIIIGKNEFSSISEFILAFDVLKKAVNNQTQEVYNELVTEELNKRNGNYSKTNVLTFFDSFIQLRNRVAHPHKEIKGVMIHWPSSLEYYEVVNNYLEKAILEVCEKLEELWSFDEAKIVDDEGDESIVEVNKTGVQQELSGISFPKGTQLLIKNEKEWICISLKETLKVGPNIIESIEKEKQEAQRLESIEELKTHIETALDDGQISADELKFFESLGKNRLGLDAGKIKEVILEVANKLEIEDPFPEVDKRLITAIDDALTSGEFNAFFLKLLAQNYGVHEDQFKEILNERAEILNVDLNDLKSNGNLTFSKDGLAKLVGVVQSMAWIQSMGVLARSGQKGIYNVERGNHHNVGTKEYLHRRAFLMTEDYVRYVIDEVQEKMGTSNEWVVKTNNWQQGNMSSYVWVKAYPKTERLSSELGLGVSLHQDDIAIGFLADWNKVTDTNKNNYGLLRNLFVQKFNKYLSDYRDEFLEYDDLKINGHGGGNYLTPLKDILLNHDNYFQHFYQFNQIRFFKYYVDLETDPSPVYNDLEISYSLFGNLVDEVIYDYSYMVDSYENPLTNSLAKYTDFCDKCAEYISVYTDEEPIKVYDPKMGTINIRYSETIKGVGVHLKIGFWEKMNGDIQFGVKFSSTHYDTEPIYNSLRGIVNQFSDKIEHLEDTCSYDGFISTLRKVDAENDSDMESCFDLIKAYVVSIVNASARLEQQIFGLSPKSELLDIHQNKFNEVLDHIAALELTSNKTHVWRNLIYNNTFCDSFGSAKKFGWHSIEYGFDLKNGLNAWIKINIHNSIRAADLIIALKSLENEGLQILSNQGGADGEAVWQMKNLNDSQISSSSDWNRNHAAKFARIDCKPKYANWSTKVNDENQWIQVDLTDPMEISEVKTQGRFNRDQWVTKYYLSWSLDGKKWTTDKDNVYDGNSDRDGHIVNVLKNPVVGRFVRIHPLEWHEHISLRFDVKAEKVESKRVHFGKRITLSDDFTESVEDVSGLFQKNFDQIKEVCLGAFGL